MAVIVPSAQRAAALRFAWARVQQQRGRAVWSTPQILTWESWLAHQWRSATLAQRSPDTRQLLSPSQERQLWALAVQEVGAQSDDPEALRAHATALMRAGNQASQSLLPLSRLAVTDEERLLAAALDRVRELCRTRGLLSLRLALPEELGFLAGCAAPVIVGQSRLTPLQQRLQQLHWPADQLLLGTTRESMAMPRLCRVASFDAEVAAVAQWCREQLQSGATRLLVISAWQEPGAHTQGALFWRALAGGGSDAGEQRPTLLAVEGGEPLHHQALVADALTALAATADEVDTSRVLQLLRSPYFLFGSAAECAALQTRLGLWGLARWQFPAWREALASVAGALPAAGRLLAWLVQVRALLAQLPRRSATDWAECFSQCLRAAGFAAGSALDSRDAQRLARWGELLDEFAGLDATLPPLDAASALQALQRLAQQSVHQVATGDAAITFTTQMHDPVVQHDGIWVMGLTENRWPAPPRPDPYVPLQEQRRCQWAEAGVSQRLQAAQWLQDRWQQRTQELVCSYAQREGDVRHRPSAMLAAFEVPWIEPAMPAERLPAGGAVAACDETLPPVSSADLALALRGGVDRLRLQQECAFRAQAKWRLGAGDSLTLTDGMPVRLRGILLHAVLEGLWGQLQDQQQLLALTPADQVTLVAKQWDEAVHKLTSAGVAWLAPGVLERERVRTLRLVERVLQLDRQRAPFVVHKLEQEMLWHANEASFAMRIDRIDRTIAGEYVLIDYKSGEAGAVGLHEGNARPLQLAAYVVALADAGLAMDAALLLSLKPAKFGYAGVSCLQDQISSRVKQVEDWPALQQQWQHELQQLLEQHLAGVAQLAGKLAACRHCSLSALCRRQASNDAIPDEEPDDE